MQFGDELAVTTISTTKKEMKFLPQLIISFMLLTGCDAVNHLQYAIENKTDHTIRVHIPNYPIDPERQEFSTKVDTTIEIKPKESLWIGTSPMDIDFPWATKRIYEETPGICGLKSIEKDTVFELDCTKSSWKYKKRWSTLKIE